MWEEKFILCTKLKVFLLQHFCNLANSTVLNPNMTTVFKIAAQKCYTIADIFGQKLLFLPKTF